MTLVKKNETLKSFGSLLTDFIDAEDLSMDKLWKRKNLPAVNVSEEEKQFVIEVAAPGMKKNDFKVSVDQGVLNIRAESKEEKEEKKKNYMRREYTYSSFNRAFDLPENASQSNIAANYIDGVLKLSIPKTNNVTTKAKEITIS